jgi:hypothetical protein
MMSVESPRNIPADTISIPAQDVTAAEAQVVVNQPSGLRYFVRRDSKGEIIPNTLTISLKKPAGSVYEFKLLK